MPDRGNAASGQAAPKTAPPQGAAVAAAAADVLKGDNERMEAGEPLTPTFTELMFEWSRRAHNAQVAAAPAKDLRIKAAQEHLGRVRDLHRVVEQRFCAGLDVSRVQVVRRRRTTCARRSCGCCRPSRVTVVNTTILTAAPPSPPSGRRPAFPSPATARRRT